MKSGLEPYLAVAHRRWLADVDAPRWREDDGTLIFYDVSGFTPLTERLATKGKAGGEELTDVLSRVFGALLAAAEAHGGDTLKFGGDAVFLHFSGPGHAHRACAAALAMQEIMGGLRTLRTTVGPIALSASCGVASGPVHMFLVGDTFREMVIAGPTTSEALALESAAEPGEVLVAAGTQAQVDGAVWGEERAGGRLLQEVVAPPPGPASDGVEGDPADGLPPNLVPYLRHTADGEHRQGVVAFLQFRGVDELLDREGPAATAAALDALIGAAQRACEHHDITFMATDCDRGAGKLFLGTGSPVAGQDDEDRMLLGLREMLAADQPLTVRAGVNRGRVFAVHLGAPHRRTYTTMGATTNLAARVMGKAPEGGLLATAAVLDRAQAPFSLRPVEPFTVKGVSAPVHGAVVGPLSAAGPRTQRREEQEHPLVGRDEERRALAALVDGAARGEGGAVELLGEVGIGKTRLLSAAPGDDRLLVTFDTQPYAAHTVYGVVEAPLRELLAGPRATDADVERALRARLPAESLRWIELVGRPLGLDLEPTPESAALAPDAARIRLALELVGVLREALPQGSIIAVDGAQWLDEASRELLTALIGGLGPHVAAIVTRRDDGTGLEIDGLRSLTLGPLAHDALVELAVGDPPPLPPAILEQAVERSHGNPLFLRELVGAVHTGAPVEALPDDLEALLAARIDTTAPADRTLLRTASVLGTRFDAELLASLAGLDHQALDAAVQRLSGFLVQLPDGDISFRQVLARDAAYEALPYRRRRELHARAGVLIAAGAGDDLDDVVALLSLHAHAAGDREQTWAMSRRAGEQAQRRGAPIEAVTFYERALAAGRALRSIPPDEVAAVAQALGDAAELAGLYDVADRAYREAHRRVRGTPVRDAELCRKRGWLRERTGSYAEALRWYTRGRAALGEATGTEADTIRGRLEVASGAARLRQGRLRESLPHLDRAAQIAERLGDEPALAHASYLLDWAHTDLGHPVEEHRRRAVEIYTRLEDWTGLANTLNNLGVNAFFAGDWEEALALYERSRQARERAGDVVRSGEALHNVGELLVDQGRLDEAEPPLRDALRLWRGARFPVGVGVALMNLGRVAARRGDDDTAAELLTEARATLEGIGSEQVLDVAVREAERHVLAARPADALHVLRPARREARRRGAPVLLAQLDRLHGAALALQGDDAGALSALRESAEQAAGTPYEEALTADLLLRIAPRAGTPVDPAWEATATATFAQLGVVRTWPPPLR